MPRPGGESLGHSKHRKAFGTKQHKSALARILLRKDMDRANLERQRIAEAKKQPMYQSVSEALKCL